MDDERILAVTTTVAAADDGAKTKRILAVETTVAAADDGAKTKRILVVATAVAAAAGCKDKNMFWW